MSIHDHFKALRHNLQLANKNNTATAAVARYARLKSTQRLIPVPYTGGASAFWNAAANLKKQNKLSQAQYAQLTGRLSRFIDGFLKEAGHCAGLVLKDNAQGNVKQIVLYAIDPAKVLDMHMLEMDWNESAQQFR